MLIPAFAVDRTELVLIALHRLLVERRVPRVPVFVDSPMALAALSVYRQSAGDGSAGLRPEAGELWRPWTPWTSARSGTRPTPCG